MNFLDWIRQKGWAFKSGEALLSPESIARRNKMAVKFKEYLEKQKEKIPVRTTNDYYFTRKCKEKSILLLGLGKSVRGNMQYILEELNQSSRFEGYKVYVRASEGTEEIVKQYVEQNGWDRTEVVAKNKRYNQLMEECSCLITETFFPANWVKTPEQTYINIWHGTPLKTLGLAKNSRNTQNNGNTQRNFINADYMLFPNTYTRDNLLTSYKVSRLMHGSALMLGYPRTGGMLSVSEEEKAKLRDVLAPNGEKVYAYMPTFKDYISNEKCVQESRELLDYLDENLGEDQILYVNLHHRVTDAIDYGRYRHIKSFPPFIDSYRLLAVTDALVTDFSSVFFDYLALKKQIVLHIEDYENYREKRGTYIDLMEFPFDKAKTKEEIIEALNRGKQYDDEQVYQQFCGYDSSENAHRLCGLLYGDVSDLEVCEISGDERETVMIYTEDCGPGGKTDFLYEYLKAYDSSRQEVYICCDMEATEKNKDTAYPMLFEYPVIGWRKNFYISSMGKAAWKWYQEEKISFKKAMKLLKYDYALAYKRIYGEAKIDFLIIYDVLDPEMLLALAFAETARKAFFVQSDQLDRIQAGDRLFENAAKLTCDYCDMIMVRTQNNVERVKLQLGKRNARKIVLVDTIEKIKESISI